MEESRPLSCRRLGATVMHPNRVLVIDDNPEVAAMEADVLRASGYHVQWTTDATAVATMRAFQPDAVVLDILMPESGGIEIAEIMRGDEALADVPIVVASGIRGITEAIEQIGTPHVVIKPFDVEELVEAVNRAIAVPAP
jgi:CheY-like chemotaxis protein